MRGAVSPATLLTIRKLNTDHLMMALKHTFERYNLWQFGTNKVRFWGGP